MAASRSPSLSPCWFWAVAASPALSPSHWYRAGAEFLATTRSAARNVGGVTFVHVANTICAACRVPTVVISYYGEVTVVVVFFALTDRASTIPSNIRGCQSGTWSQRGTKVNRSHHGDNPLLRPTGIQIATKSYTTLQAMAPTNIKTVHQTSFTPYREQPRSTRIVVAYPRPAFSATNRTNTFQPVLINNSKFLKATHRTKIRKIEIPRSMVVEALSW